MVPKCNQKAVAKYNKANYDRINLVVPKGERDTIRTYAEKRGISLNAYAVEAIHAAMAKDDAN